MSLQKHTQELLCGTKSLNIEIRPIKKPAKSGFFYGNKSIRYYDL